MTNHPRWALILGASSGFGEATSLELAHAGYDIFGVHLDRKATQANAERIVAEIRGLERQAEFHNVNAADAARRTEVCDAIAHKLSRTDPGHPLAVVLHTLAFGTLKPFIADKPEDQVTQAQLEMTIDVMANSLVYWIQDLCQRKLIGKGTRIFAMTSAGGHRVWPTYGAVSAAKAALEAHVRQLAVELAPRGTSVNAIRAGVTDTPSLRKIPGHEEMMAQILPRHPGKRLTATQDVARFIRSMMAKGTEWCTGNVIGVDGAEFVI